MHKSVLVSANAYGKELKQRFLLLLQCMLVTAMPLFREKHKNMSKALLQTN